MKFNRIAAMSLLALITTVSVAGCSEKPLSNEEACQEIMKQAKQQNLGNSSTNSLGDIVEQGKKVSAVLHNVADKAEPEFSADLRAVAENADAQLAVFTDDSLDLQQMQMKLSRMTTEETRARSEMLETTCPGLSDL